MKYDVNDVSAEGFSDHIMENGLDNGVVKFTFDGSRAVDVPMRLLVLNSILWRPYIKLGVPITKDKWVTFSTMAHIYEGLDVKHVKGCQTQKAVGANVCSDYQTKQYAELLEQHDSDVLLTLFWETINNLYAFVHRHMGDYAQSLSLLSLARVQSDPAVTKLTDTKMDSKLGSEICETIFRGVSKSLCKVLGERGAIKDNALLPFMETGALKTNQIPQQMYAYGPRSDVDDRVFKHIINNSSVDGLIGVEDFAAEAGSAKKSSFYNKIVICDTQYFARVLRLHSLGTAKCYKGHCGNTTTLPIYIRKEFVKQFVGKRCFIDGVEHLITEDNLSDYAGRQVNLVTPLTCRHSDGICEYCAGRATSKPWAYIPSVHIGLYSATKVGAASAQMVLSAKHLNAVNTIVMQLNESSKKWLNVIRDNIYFLPTLESSIKSYSLRLPASCIENLADLDSESCNVQTLSNIIELELVGPKGSVDLSVTFAKEFIPNFSEEFLVHLRKCRSQQTLEVDERNNYVIPLNGFDISQPFLNYMIISADAVAFTKAVDSMFKTGIRTAPGETSDLSRVLTDITDLLYSKTTVNIFFIEVLLKSFLLDPNGSSIPPAVTDVHNVILGGMDKNIEHMSVAAKLGHERLGVDNYLANPATVLQDKQECALDKYFGF